MAPPIGSSSPSLWADSAPYSRIHSKLGKSNVDIQWNVENTWKHVGTVHKLENHGRLFTEPPFSANAQIWQSTKPGQKWRPFCEGIGEQKVTKISQKTSSGSHPQDSQRDIGNPLGGFPHIFRQKSYVSIWSRLGCMQCWLKTWEIVFSYE